MPSFKEAMETRKMVTRTLDHAVLNGFIMVPTLRSVYSNSSLRPMMY